MRNEKKSITIYGPQGIGKPLFASKIAEYFGLEKITDEWIQGTPIPENSVVLIDMPGIDGAKDFFEIMEEINKHYENKLSASDGLVPSEPLLTDKLKAFK
ncbi:MAG: hypothetical protein ACU85E_16055 [Gammaproteobacteria bacterium]